MLQIAGTTGFTETVSGYVTPYTTGSPRDAVGNQLPYQPGASITNSATVPLSSSGQINAFVGAAAGDETNLLCDVTGYSSPRLRVSCSRTAVQRRLALQFPGQLLTAVGVASY